jgi:Bacterial archaeo-eukaryotic release factor family 3
MDMEQQTFTEASNALTAHEIKALAAASGPAVTILLPPDRPNTGGAPVGENRRLPRRLGKAIEEAERQLAERGVDAAEARTLLDPVRELANSIDSEAAPGQCLALFGCGGEFRYYRLPQAVKPTVAVGENFYVRPFLGTLEGEKVFYLLALSQKDMRLLRCTQHSAEEVDTGDRIPRNLQDFLETARPDHVLDNRSTAGPAAGDSRGVVFGTVTDRESQDRYLSAFFRQADRGVNDMIRSTKLPLVLCGVDYEVALYRRVNTYPGLVEQAVHGAPNGLKGGEMHARALECLNADHEQKVDDVIARHARQAGEIAVAGVKDIVRAAWDGRVLDLLVADQAAVPGSFDEAAHEVNAHRRPQNGDEDLINAAAIQAIAHGGRVFVVPRDRMPGKAPLAAVMRY